MKSVFFAVLLLLSQCILFASFNVHGDEESSLFKRQNSEKTTFIYSTSANINSVEIKERDDRQTALRFIIEVKNRAHLAKVIKKIRLIKSVSQIDRH